MKKISLILTVVLLVALTALLSGCGKEEQSLDGLYVATFELEGGTLETPTSSVSTKINFAYHPGTKVLDPSVLNGYKLNRIGYVFTGWYTDKSCSESSKWDFDSYINSEKVTLYAGWKKAISLTYTLYYLDENNEKVSLGKYEVESGDKFKDLYDYAKGRKGYTPIPGFFSDPECTVAWDSTYGHEGTDTDLDIPVYVKHIEGTWKFVDNLDSLKKELSNKSNIQLMNDIDCQGAALAFGDYNGKYTGELAGNGFAISNFTVKVKSNNECSIFSNLADGAKGANIHDVSFTGVTYDLTGADYSKLKFAALSILCASNRNVEANVSNVTISGNVIVDSAASPDVSKLIYEISDTADVTEEGNTVEITVNN